jgi:hypothetical protein
MATVVDFIPVFDSTKDFRKVVDTNRARFNTIVLAVLNQIYMEQPTLTDWPEVGGYQHLLSLHFNTSYEEVVTRLSENLSMYTDYNIEVEVESYDENSRTVNIGISIKELPDLRFNFDLEKDQKGSVRVVNPDMIVR